MSAPIFISYSSKDQEIAETIYQALEARGLDCWIACRDVHAGENFQEAIVRALRAAKVMVLVFTSNANNSDEIKKELVLAGRHHVTVVPVRVEDVVPNDAFTYEFATRQWIDLFKDWEREIELLATQIGHVLQTAKPDDGGVGVAAAVPARRPVRRSSNRPLLWGSALAAVLILIGGGMFYMRPFTKTSPAAVTPAVPPASQIAAQTPAAAPLPPVPTPPPAPAQQAAAPAAAPAAPVQTAPLAPAPSPPAPTPQADPDDAAWQTAAAAATPAALESYLKDFSAGVHVQEAQLRLADLIRSSGAASKTFDGTWQTTWTCTNLGQYPGYSYQFAGQVKDGAYHGLRGIKGEPSSLVLDGKIEPDGTAGFFGEIIVGSSIVALGAPRGTPSDFHALAHFDSRGGNGKRVEGRPCTLTFAKQ